MSRYLGGLFILALTIGTHVPSASAVPSSAVRNACVEIKKKLYPIFRTQFEDVGGGYRPYFCPSNTANLIDRLKAKGFALENAYVVQLNRYEDVELDEEMRRLPPEKKLLVYPSQARNGTTTWSFHVFLVYEGLVLDQDYKNEPDILPLEDYMRKMWNLGLKSSSPRNAKTDEIWIQVRPVDGYGENGKEMWGTLSHSLYPLRTVKEFLSEKLDDDTCARTGADRRH